MHKLAFATVAAISAFTAPALAGVEHWNVTEERTTGAKVAQGDWAVTIEGEKLGGSATMYLDNGSPLTYELEGTVKDGVYTVKLNKRSDDRKGCTWTGHADKATATGKATGLVGDVACDGAKLLIRAHGN